MTSNTSTEEEKQSDKKDVKGFLVCEGAKCYCSSAKVFKNKANAVKLKVTSHKNFEINKQKNIATDKDNTLQNLDFIECTDPKNTQTGYSPCKSSLQITWKKFYENMELDQKGLKPLLDISEGMCPGYGVPGTIKFADHGQKEEITSASFKNVEIEQLQMMSPLADVPVPEEKLVIPKVSEISLTYIHGKGTKTAQSKLTNGKAEIVKVRIGEKLEFTTSKFTGTEKLLSWIVYKKGKEEPKSGDVFFKQEKKGKKFTATFEEEGIYRVECYGNPDVKKADENFKSYNDSSFDLQVIQNAIEKIEGPKAERCGMPLTFTAKFKLEPTAEESASIKWRVLDNKGNIYQEEEETTGESYTNSFKDEGISSYKDIFTYYHSSSFGGRWSSALQI